jgi:hypothetical protein
VADTPINREAHETGCGETASVPVEASAIAYVTEPFVPGEPAPSAVPMPAPTVPPTTELPRACLYRVQTPPQSGSATWSELGTVDGEQIARDGEFLRAVDLTAEQRSAVLEAANGTPAVDSCSTEPTLFATFPPHPSAEGLAIDPGLIAELDGCRRLFVAFQTAYAVPGSVAEALVAEAGAAG